LFVSAVFFFDLLFSKIHNSLHQSVSKKLFENIFIGILQTIDPMTIWFVKDRIADF